MGSIRRTSEELFNCILQVVQHKHGRSQKVNFVTSSNFINLVKLWCTKLTEVEVRLWLCSYKVEVYVNQILMNLTIYLQS